MLIIPIGQTKQPRPGAGGAQTLLHGGLLLPQGSASVLLPGSVPSPGPLTRTSACLLALQHVEVSSLLPGTVRSLRTVSAV